MIHSHATDADDPTEDPRWGRVGQKIEDTGPLNRKRMETIDDETTAAAIDFMTSRSRRTKPFFTWMNTTRMHAFTHVRPSMLGQSGMPDNEYADGMIEHDGDAGNLLKAVDDLGIANNTIVVYTTDNGPHLFSWPDAAMTPFRNEKNSNWGWALSGCRQAVAGPHTPGTVTNELFSGFDWFPTLLDAAGDPGVKDQLLTGWQPEANGATFKVHLDGYDQLAFLTGAQPKSARTEFYYFNDDGDLVDMRFGDWKVVFEEQRAPGGFAVWKICSPSFGRRRCSICAWTPMNAPISWTASVPRGFAGGRRLSLAP